MALSAPTLVAAARCAAAIPTLYSIMSVNEYITHRYYQHEEFNKEPFLQNIWCKLRGIEKPPKLHGGGHVEHHAETYDDMSLKMEERWLRTPAAKSLDSDPFRGTAFTWAVTGMMIIQMLPLTLPAFAMLGFSLAHTFAWLLPGMLLHALLWNALHPPMHGLPNVPISVGAPSAILAPLRNTFFFKWIYENHMGHHVLGGQANYNVCCPLVDHVVGTYVKLDEWTKKMRPLPVNALRRGAPVEPDNVPVPPPHPDLVPAMA